MALLREWAERQPQKIAIRMAETGAAQTYAELDQAANQVAHWFLSMGLQAGDTVALLLENHPRTFQIWWGARRAGLYYVPISTHLTADEVNYIVRDAGARILITSYALRATAEAIARESAQDAFLSGIGRFMLDGTLDGYRAYENEICRYPASATLPERPVGREFMYSSGTTGFPKGIRRALQPYAARFDFPMLERRLREIFQFDDRTVYLSTSPLYHALSRFVIRTIECGGTSVILQKFDARTALAAIERYRVTHSHWVPTMLIRLLALPPDMRQGFDVSSMRCAIHAAAPCPAGVKQAMIDWWGPVIEEYYGGSENLGVTHIRSDDWLQHRGSVGRPITGAVHIVAEDDRNRELPAGEIGMIYFEGGVPFQYHNAAEKTDAVFNERGWGTYGDLGHVDEQGYLYLSDRRTDLIISGGVNIYPSEIERVIVSHLAVEDAAVIGIPHAEFGQEVKAVVQVRDPASSKALSDEIMALCRQRLASIKCPRSIDLVDDLPRTENGKLLKRVLRDRYALSAPATLPDGSADVIAASGN